MITIFRNLTQLATALSWPLSPARIARDNSEINAGLSNPVETSGKPLERKFQAFVYALMLTPLAVTAQGLTLERAVSLAQKNDPWLIGSHHREQASAAQSIAAGQLPDPVLSLGFANLPVDSFDLEQEPMTQLRLGLSQAFPRGDTRVLKRRQMDQMSARHGYMREERKARIAVEVTKLWLEIYRNRQAIRLMQQDRSLFQHLVEVAQSSYSSGVGNTRQQDLVRSQLELTRLEDRLAQLRQKRAEHRAKLAEWIAGVSTMNFVVAEDLPELSLVNPHIINATADYQGHLQSALLSHPVIKILNQKIIASGTGVKLARQKYKPQWALNASYGYREDDQLGTDRSDFFSIGASFDLPLFTSRRQDKEVQSAMSIEAAIKTDKTLALRSLRSNFEIARVRLQQLNQRKALYQQRLLKELHTQAEASLTAYTNDDGDFAEAVRARIAELNANIDFLNIRIDRLQTVAELNYFFTPAGAGAVTGARP